MTKRSIQLLTALVVSWCFYGLGADAVQNEVIVKPTKDLYYFVIDRSGSISPNGLVMPIRGAVIDFVGKLSQDTSVEMVFFDTVASSPKRWETMDLSSKGDLTTYFYEQFKPTGFTRLYDTIAEVIERAKKEAPRYRVVNIIILTDGVDEGPRGTLGSKKYLSWDSVEVLAKDFKIVKSDSLICVLHLGNQSPIAKLSPTSPIEQVAISDAQKGFVIKSPVPKADFTCSPTKAQVNEPVLFVLESEIGVEKAQWSFGDGSSSFNLKPHHSFVTEGSYTVKVTVSGAGGESTSTKPKAIQVLRNVSLEASFKWSPQTVRIHQKVQLVDESIGSPDSWSWEVTGLASMNERSPTLDFDTAGTKTVTLTIGKEGQKHSVSKNFDVLPPAPIKASFKWSPDPVRVGEKVQFVDASLGSPDSWAWEFTGLPSMTERSPIVEFTKAGPVTATLTIEKDGQKNSESLNFEVLPVAPLKSAFKWSPEKIRVGEKVQFVDESLGSPDSWSWEFAGQQSNDKSPVTVFSKPGPVTVSLTVGKDKRADTDKQTIEIFPPPPPSLNAAFSISPAQGICPLEVQFKDKSQGAIASYRWDFGDGQTSDIKDPKHTYQKAGSWAPRLTIRNADRQEARDAGEIVIAVSNPPPPPPWWRKPLIYGLLALAAWVFLIVPLVLRPLLAPQPKVSLQGGASVYSIRSKAARGLVNWFWPRSSVTVGMGKKGDIRVGNSAENTLLARVSRMPMSNDYTLTVLKSDAIKKSDASHLATPENLALGRTCSLRTGDAFMFPGNTRLTWEQPSKKSDVKTARKG